MRIGTTALTLIASASAISPAFGGIYDVYWVPALNRYFTGGQLLVLVALVIAAAFCLVKFLESLPTESYHAPEYEENYPPEYEEDYPPEYEEDYPIVSYKAPRRTTTPEEILEKAARLRALKEKTDAETNLKMSLLQKARVEGEVEELREILKHDRKIRGAKRKIAQKENGK